MEYILDNLPCKPESIKSFKSILKMLEVEKQYTKVFSKLNDDYFVNQGLWFLSSQDKQEYLKENNLSQVINELELDVSESSLEYLISDIKTIDINDFVNEHPDISFTIVEMIYYDTNKFLETVKFANAEKYLYEKSILPSVLDTIIKNLSSLLSHSLLIPMNIHLLAERLIDVNQYTHNQRLALSKKIIGIYKTLHSLRGTRICIFDSETTGTAHPLPIQIAYLLLDINLNILGSNSFYIQQESIETGATNVHGVTSKSLHNQLDADQPEVVYDQIMKVLSDKRLILVAHNISFDMRTLKNYAEQCGEEFNVPGHTFCTYYNHRDFIKDDLPKYDLKSLKSYSKITDEEIIDEISKIFKNDDFHPNSHDAVFDTVTLYEVLKRNQFLRG